MTPAPSDTSDGRGRGAHAGVLARVLDRIRTAPMFALFLLSYTLVHLHFEYNFWAVGEGAMFAKYGAGDLLEVSQRVYYTKAVWCFVMIWLLAIGLSVDAALAFAFALYGILLVALFPFRIYAGLNLLLALGMVIEVFVRRRLWAPGRPAPTPPPRP